MITRIKRTWRAFWRTPHVIVSRELAAHSYTLRLQARAHGRVALTVFGDDNIAFSCEAEQILSICVHHGEHVGTSIIEVTVS